MKFKIGRSYSNATINCSFLDNMKNILDSIPNISMEGTPKVLVEFESGDKITTHVEGGMGGKSYYDITYTDEIRGEENLLYYGYYYNGSSGGDAGFTLTRKVDVFYISSYAARCVYVDDSYQYIAPYLSWEETDIDYDSKILYVDSDKSVKKIYDERSIKTSYYTPIKEGEAIMTLPDGSVWERIFWHDVSTETTYFSSFDEVMECNLSNRYSNLKNIDKYMNAEGNYEIMLRYPLLYNDTKYNRWVQTNSPLRSYNVSEYDGNINGYSPIHLDFTKAVLGYGLGISSGYVHGYGGLSSYVALNCGGGSFYGGIGFYQCTEYGEDGFETVDKNTYMTKKEELWMRIDKRGDFVKYQGDDTYFIYTLDGLKAFRDSVNAGNDYAGKTIRLMSYINMDFIKKSPVESGADIEDWIPIGKSSDTPFRGTFDGNGFSLSYFKMWFDDSVNVEGSYGLFGFNSGIIKNIEMSLYHWEYSTSGSLNIENININVETSASTTPSYVGLICGRNLGGGIIEKCRISSALIRVNNKKTFYHPYIGLCVGENDGVVRDVMCSGKIYGMGNEYTGGLVGGNFGKIYGCSVDVNIQGGYVSGGLCGLMSSGGSSISNCFVSSQPPYPTVTYSSTIESIGGIVGQLAGGLVSNNLSLKSGSFDSATYRGLLCGNASGGTFVRNYSYPVLTNITNLWGNMSGGNINCRTITQKEMYGDSLLKELGSGWRLINGIAQHPYPSSVYGEFTYANHLLSTNQNIGLNGNSNKTVYTDWNGDTDSIRFYLIGFSDCRKIEVEFYGENELYERPVRKIIYSPKNVEEIYFENIKYILPLERESYDMQDIEDSITFRASAPLNIKVYQYDKFSSSSYVPSQYCGTIERQDKYHPRYNTPTLLKQNFPAGTGYYWQIDSYSSVDFMEQDTLTWVCPESIFCLRDSSTTYAVAWFVASCTGHFKSDDDSSDVYYNYATHNTGLFDEKFCTLARNYIIREGTNTFFAPSATDFITAPDFTIAYTGTLNLSQREYEVVIDKNTATPYVVFTDGTVWKNYTLDESVACFRGEMKVKTQNGFKNIKDVVIGDKLYSKNFETGENEYSEVTELYNHKLYIIREITLEDDSKIFVTSKHPLYVKDKGEVRAALVTTEDELINSNGDIVKIKENKKIYVENEPMYEAWTKNGNYYVGESSILVYNEEKVKREENE